MRGIWVASFLLLLSGAWGSVVAQAPSTQSYEQGATDLINSTKRQYGTADEESALDSALSSRSDATGDTTITEAEKAANPYYTMVTEAKGDIKTCNLERTVQVLTGQHLKEISGEFWLKGIRFDTDLHRCTENREYIPYQVTVDDPPTVQTLTADWSSIYYASVGTDNNTQGKATVYYDETGAACYGTVTNGSFSYAFPGVHPYGASTADCEAAIKGRLVCTGGTVTGGTTATTSTSGTAMVQLTTNYRTSWTCTIPQNHQETRLREEITNNCQNWASCKLLEDVADSGGTRTISGVTVSPPWWVRNKLYSCLTNHECSAWPTSEEECGTWFSPDFAGCKNTMDTGIKAIALRKFQNIEGNLSCNPFLVQDLSAPTSTQMVAVERTRQVPKIVEVQKTREVNLTRPKTVLVDEQRTRQVPQTTTISVQNGFNCREGVADEFGGTGWENNWWSATNCTGGGGYYIIAWECGTWSPTCTRRKYHYGIDSTPNMIQQTTTTMVTETYTVQVPMEIQEAYVVQETYTAFETQMVDEVYTEMVTQTLVGPAPDYTLPSTSPFFWGCGTFQDARTEQFRFLGADHTKLGASCLLTPQPLPLGLLDQREDVSDQPGQMKVRYLTFDYAKEEIVDGCAQMLDAYRSQNVTCDFMEESADGLLTHRSGTRISSVIPRSCKTKSGTLRDYEFCREFWSKKRKYRCHLVPPEVKTDHASADVGTAPNAPDAPSDAPGFGEAAGTLAMVDQIAKDTQSMSCAAPNPDGTCNSDYVRLFAGGGNKCTQWSPGLQAANYHCCKAGLVDQCEGVGALSTCTDFCNTADIETSRLVYDQNTCEKVGTYCSNKVCVGVTINGNCQAPGYWQCLEKKTSYCCFDSLLGRILQQQGRTQLGKSWGSAEHPSCDGYTIDEFSKLDFSKMDLGEFVDSLNTTPKTTTEPDPAAAQDKIRDSVQGLNENTDINTINEGMKQSTSAEQGNAP